MTRNWPAPWPPWTPWPTTFQSAGESPSWAAYAAGALRTTPIAQIGERAVQAAGELVLKGRAGGGDPCLRRRGQQQAVRQMEGRAFVTYTNKEAARHLAQRLHGG